MTSHRNTIINGPDVVHSPFAADTIGRRSLPSSLPLFKSVCSTLRISDCLLAAPLLYRN